MSFAVPVLRWFALATALGLTIAFALAFTWRRRELERAGDAAQLLRMTGSLSLRRRGLRAALLVLAVTLAVAALARPQVKGQSSWRQRGIDVAVVVDFSKSMLARDVYPDRLQRALLEVNDLIGRLAADRVAAVAYAGLPLHFPLSHDHQAVRTLFDGLHPRDMPPGSDLGQAILVARCILRPDLAFVPGCERVAGRGGGGAAPATRGGAPPSPGAVMPPLSGGTGRLASDRARALVVFTDGDDTRGRARAEVSAAAAQGIEVYLVGVGSEAGELVPEFDAQGNEVGWKRSEDGGSLLVSRLDEAGLLELAVAAGGEARYLHLGRKRLTAERLMEHLERLKKGDLDQRVVHQPEEVYHWFLFPALLLLLLETCLSERRRRSAPPLQGGLS
jgi:Ca-activated chloride channel family protein